MYLMQPWPDYFDHLLISHFPFQIQTNDVPPVGTPSHTGMQRKDGKLFFKSPRSKAPPADKEVPPFVSSSGKIVLKGSPKQKMANGSRGKQQAMPSWLNDIDDVFSFHAED